jgi:predicted transport protein
MEAVVRGAGHGFTRNRGPSRDQWVFSSNHYTAAHTHMPLFQIKNNTLEHVDQSQFKTERELQRLVEASLGPVFQSRYVATEFPTGVVHGGRIDTLALSEDNNPVIIEYKKVASSELVNQALYYLAWIHDHKGDFQEAARKALGAKTAVDWSDVRVICLAPAYKKFDVHAVQIMGPSIELWTYRLFGNDTLYLEEIRQKDLAPDSGEPGKNPVMVAAGKKAAQTKKTATWTFEQHIDGKSAEIRDIALAVQEFVQGLDTSIEERPKKQYVAYRTTQNIVCLEVQHKKIYLYLKLSPKEVEQQDGYIRDVSEIGHFGTGDVEVTLKTLEDFEKAKPLIQKAYEKLGG